MHPNELTLNEYVDRTLDRDEHAQVARHLETCEACRQVVDDVANRKALFERFAYSQQFSQSDPWAERARRGVDRNEFAPIAELEHA